MNLLEFPVEIISALLELADPRAVVLCRGVRMSSCWISTS